MAGTQRQICEEFEESYHAPDPPFPPGNIVSYVLCVSPTLETGNLFCPRSGGRQLNFCNKVKFQKTYFYQTGFLFTPRRPDPPPKKR